MAGCVFGYFADCTVVMPLFLRIANAFVPKCGRRNAEVQASSQVVTCKGVVTGLALSQVWHCLMSPHFIMFSG